MIQGVSRFASAALPAAFHLKDVDIDVEVVCNEPLHHGKLFSNRCTDDADALVLLDGVVIEMVKEEDIEAPVGGCEQEMICRYL